MTQEALKRIAEKLRRAGASLPAPELTGTIEGSVVTGLCIALALVESETEALAQPEQEPVALRDVIAVNLMREGINNKHRARELAEHFIKLTTPPQRTWVGLTDEEMKECIKTSDYNQGQYKRTLYLTHLSIAIEAKLKQKNGYAEEKNT
jgi:hypothetical protein